MLLICGVAQAADEPDFKSAIVTQSSKYPRQTSAVSIMGIDAAAKTVDMSRVAVAIDGVIVTGEWEPKTLDSATYEDFPAGTDVPAAATRNKLFLKLPDGSVVSAKVVRREKQTPQHLDR